MTLTEKLIINNLFYRDSLQFFVNHWYLLFISIGLACLVLYLAMKFKKGILLSVIPLCLVPVFFIVQGMALEIQSISTNLRSIVQEVIPFTLLIVLSLGAVAAYHR